MFTITLLTVQISQFGEGLKPPVNNQYSPEQAGQVGGGDAALNSMTAMISNILAIATAVAGIYFIVYFIMAAFSWITSEGDSGKLQKARNQMIQAIIGLALIVATYAVVGLVGHLIGIDILNPATVLKGVVPQ